MDENVCPTKKSLLENRTKYEHGKEDKDIGKFNESKR
jgi:hypothetical protein